MSAEIPLMLRGRNELGAILNRVSEPVNAARDAKAKSKPSGVVSHLPTQLATLARRLDALSEALEDEEDTDNIIFANAGARAALSPVLEALPEAEARAKQHARIVASLEPAVTALADGCELMMELNRNYEARHMAGMAAAIARAKPRSFSGEPMLARSAVKRVVPGQQRSGPGVGKRRGGGGAKRGKGHCGK